MAGELLAGILLLIAGVKDLRNSRTCPLWGNSQKWTYAGGTAGLAVFFFGFMVIGGNLFIMYLNSKWNGLKQTFQNAVMTMLMLILVTGVLIGGQLAHEHGDSKNQH